MDDPTSVIRRVLEQSKWSRNTMPKQLSEEIAAALRNNGAIATPEQLDQVLVGEIVRSASGSIACRFDATNGVVFGDERPFPWAALALPAQLLWSPEWAT